MSVGKYLSLEEARKKGLLKRFIKEHQSRGDMNIFDKLLNRMAKSGMSKKPDK